MGLAELRKSKNLTQRELAERAGLPYSRIAAIETRKRPIEDASFKTVLRLADALKVRDLRKLLDD